MMKKKWTGGNHREHCPVSSSSIWSFSSEVFCNSPISQGYYQFSLNIWYHIWYYVYCLHEMFYPNRFLFWDMRYEEYLAIYQTMPLGSKSSIFDQIWSIYLIRRFHFYLKYKEKRSALDLPCKECHPLTPPPSA